MRILAKKSPPRTKQQPSKFYFDDKAAARVCDFFGHLQHIKGPKGGEPFRLEQWQKDRIINPLFGWKRSSDNTRRYRIAYIELPRGNGKSTLCAGIALALSTIDGEQGAEVYSVAKTQDQATLVFEPAKEMVRRWPALANRSKILESVKRISFPSTASFYRPIASDDGGAHGFNSHGIIFDEFHAQPKRDLYDTMLTSTGKRKQPLTVIITTAGSSRASICWELHQHAVAVAANPDLDPSFLPVIYAASPGDDWTDESVWAKANPNLGISVEIEYLREQAARAKENVALENTFRRLHLNQWTEQDVRIIPMDAWRECATAESEDELKGKQCFAGLDLASTRDVTCWCLVFNLGGGKFAWKPTFWLPREAVSKRTDQDRRLMEGFIAQGQIKTTPGNECDYFTIAAHIAADIEKYNVRGVGFDPWNSAMLVQHLQSLRIRESLFAKLPQTFSTYNEPFKRLLGAIAAKNFVHFGCPVLDWMACNTAHKEDHNGNIKPDKGSSDGKIDGICAGLMGLWLLTKGGISDSIYEGRGMRTL